MTRKITKQELLTMCYRALLDGAKIRRQKEAGVVVTQIQLRQTQLGASLRINGGGYRQ
jgi:hypothetical protein